MIESTDVISQEVKTQLKHIIIDALNRKYISTSSHMNYTTGNRYQSVVLGGENIGGYRKDRSELFSLLNFTGRSVLDCGCNIGELSRLARHRGAVLVDGIEYDGYFVQIAQLINAYHAMTRVSVTQGDLTNEATIQDSYDITLAFSVFPYVLPVLAKLAKATGEALVLETHNITSDLWKIYIEPLTMYFPHYTFVDYTDLGDSDGKRAVFIFSKERRTLSPGGFIASTIDLRRSDFQFIGSMMQFTSEVLGDCPRDRGALERLVHEAASLPDDTRCLTAGRTYWLQMMKGYLEYARQGEVRIDNTYVTFLRSVLETLKYDVVLADRLSSNHALLERVRLRFSDIDILAESDRSLAPIDPVHLSSLSDGAGRFPVIHGETGKTIWANGLDGYHRIFWASFFGVEKVPALFLL